MYAWLFLVLCIIASVSFFVGYSLPKKSPIREGYLWVNEKIDDGGFYKVRGSHCGCCGSDFAGWLYAPKFLNLTIFHGYHITVYGNVIIGFEENA